jgi:hypothetical protein
MHENVMAASAVGMHAVQVRGVEEIRRFLVSEHLL